MSLLIVVIFRTCSFLLLVLVVLMSIFFKT